MISPHGTLGQIRLNVFDGAVLQKYHIAHASSD
jgi:hypothetical protein